MPAKMPVFVSEKRRFLPPRLSRDTNRIARTGTLCPGVKQVGLLVLLGILLSPPVLAQSPIISEFLAVNGGLHRDEDTHFSDWIEVHNPGAQTVRLEGWALTDDPTTLRWRFPAVDLLPGEFLVVFASGKSATY